MPKCERLQGVRSEVPFRASATVFLLLLLATVGL